MTALPLALFLVSSPIVTQEAGAVFDAAVVVADEESRFESLLDLDGDGDQDVVGYWKPLFTTGEIAGMLNDGAGGFEEAWRFDQQLEPWGVVVDFGVGHLDGDGRGDFAIASEESIWLYRSQGAALPALYATFSTLDYWISSFLLADFDGDGLDDVALYKHNSIEIWLNQGPGAPFVLSDAFPSEGLFNRPIFPVEANGDGKPDIMLEWSGVRVHYVADGKKVGGDLLPHDDDGFGDWRYIAGDVGGDGDLDIAGFRPNGTYAVLERIGPDVFSAHPLGTGGPADELADVDADGDVDGVRCAGGGEGSENNEAAWFGIATNDGSGAFAPPFSIEALGAHHIAGVDDVDADGDADLVAGRVVYYADGPITGPVDQPVPPEYIGDSGSPIFEAVDFCDPDRDGDVDVMFAVQGYLHSAGDGTLAWVAGGVPDPHGLKLVGPGYPGDWDGDGDVDLLVTARIAGTATAVHMRLLLNLGQGQLFDAGPASDAPFEPYFAPWDAVMSAADLDSDGDQDVLWGEHAIEVWWNDGGFFTDGASYSGYPKAYADVNGDGIVDVLQRLDDFPGLRLGQTDGTFGPVQLFLGSPEVDYKDPIAVADLDGDGDLDFATQSNRVIHLYWNDGTASFTLDALTLYEDPATGDNWELEPHVNFDRYLAARDLDDDGDTDVIAGPIDGAENASFVFRNQGLGSFTASRQVLLANALVDMDADGDPEALGNRFVYGRTRQTPADGFRRQYGAGDAGSCEVTPLLGASGSLRVGSTVTLHVSGVDAGMPGILAAGLQPSLLPDFPLVGITALTWPWIAHIAAPIPSGPGVHPGDSAATISFPVNPIWPYLGDLYHQAFYLSLAPCTESFAASSNGLILRYAPALP